MKKETLQNGEVFIFTQKEKMNYALFITADDAKNVEVKCAKVTGKLDPEAECPATVIEYDSTDELACIKTAVALMLEDVPVEMIKQVPMVNFDFKLETLEEIADEAAKVLFN